MMKSVYTKKSIWPPILILLIAIAGIAFFFRHSSQSEGPVVSAGSQMSSSNKMSAENKDAKTFRQALSDIAWGRNRKQDHTNKFEANVAPVTPDDGSPDAQQQALLSLQSRMAYCAQNWQKDPSCGAQPQPNKTK